MNGPKYFAAGMEAPQPEMVLDAETRERLSRLKSGSILIAREALKDPNFDATIVLICVYNEDGAYGVVMNRPSHMPLSEMFDGFSGLDKQQKVYIGGPVKQDELQILQVTDTPAENAYCVAPRVYLGGQWNDLERVVSSQDSTSLLFLGYSGWAPGQLEFEIIAGAWEVYNVDVQRFLAEPEEHWRGSVADMEKHLQRLKL
jgi:putative transcriptional regulator